MQVKFDNCDYNKLKANFIEASKSADFKYMIEKLNMPKEELMRHTSKIEESCQELKNCKNCKSLYECQNRIKGYVFYPKKTSNRLTFNYVACKYEKAKLKLEATNCQYFEMPASLKSASMANILVDDEKRISVIKWLKNFYDTYPSNPHQKGLYLHGSFGSGKTYLVCAMLNELAKKKVDITIVYYPELLRSLKETFDNPEYDFSSRINKVKNTSILFLDDIGAESVTAWSRDEILGTILQYRMDSNLPTFFTSNLTIEELEIHLSTTKNGVDKVKSRRIIERIKQLSIDMELVSKNRRN